MSDKVRVETWKQIIGFHYAVSNIGRVRNTKSNRILALCKSNKHPFYLVVSLSNGKKHLAYPVHILVAKAFIGERPNGYHVAHLDGNAFNNNLENLSYVTPLENSHHKKAHGTLLFGENLPTSKLKLKEVVKIKKLLKNGVKQIYIAKNYGVTQSAINCIASGKSWGWVDEYIGKMGNQI